MIRLITYDLHKPQRDYDDVIAVIQAADGGWVHIEESVWLVDTAAAASNWRDELKATASDATYFVVRLRQNWASVGLSPTAVNWLKGDGRRW